MIPRRSTAVVGELKRDAEVLFPDQRDGALKVVFVAAHHAHLVALNGGLHFQLGVLESSDDGFRLVRLDSLHDFYMLPDRTHGRLLDAAVIEGLERDLTLDELALHDVPDAAQLLLVIADQNDLLRRQLDRALAALEIEALRELFLSLLNGVRHFLVIGFRNDVERRVLRHSRPPASRDQSALTTCTPAGGVNLNVSAGAARG